MNINRFLKFYDAASAVGGAAGGGDAAAGAAGQAAPAAGAGTGAASGAVSTASAQSNGAAASAQSNSALSPSDIRSLMNEKGEFTSPDWAKQLGLPEGFASKFKTVDGALKSYANLEKMLGNSNKVAVPGENASKEEVALFRAKIGVPEKADGYKIAKPEGIPDELWGADRVGAYQAKAHELGLTAKQAEGLAQWQAEQLGGDVKANQAALTAHRDATVAELKKEWGGNFDANVALAEKGAAAAGLTADVLKSTPELSNNPHFIRAMQAVALKLGEDRSAANIRAAAGGNLAVNTPEAAAMEISKIRADANHAYNNPKASPRDREAAVAYVQKLYAIKNPEEQS